MRPGSQGPCNNKMREYRNLCRGTRRSASRPCRPRIRVRLWLLLFARRALTISRISRLGRFGLLAVGHDVIRRNDKIVIIDKIDLRPPAPPRLAFAGKVGPGDLIFITVVALREQNAGRHMKAVDPGGLKFPGKQIKAKDRDALERLALHL